MRKIRASDDGFSLVELMVTMVILVIFALMVSSLLINGMFTQQRVQNTTTATTDAQNAFEAMTHDVRYAQDVRVDGAGTLLRTITWVGKDGETGSYVCRGWYYDSSENVLRRTLVDTETQGATTSSAAAWPVFAKNAEAYAPFSQIPDGVEIEMTITPHQRGVPTSMDTVVMQREQPAQGVVPCF